MKLLEELRDEDALDGVGYSEQDIDVLIAELESDVADADASPGRNLRRHERFDRLEKALNRLTGSKA